MSRVYLLKPRRRSHTASVVLHSAAAENTGTTNAMGPDAFTWSNTQPVIDGHGNIIVSTEDDSSNHHFTYSNDGGATWADASMNEFALLRGAMWLDDVHHFLHVVWVCTGISDGILYRRYVVSYTGTAIADIVSDITIGAHTNTQLDNGANETKQEHIHIIPVPERSAPDATHYGCFVVMWGASSNTAGEVRASMLDMGTNATAGQTLGNWIAPISADTTSMGAGTAPNVTYSRFASGTGSAAAGNVPYFAIARHANGAHAKGLILAYWDGTSYKWRRAEWSAGTSLWAAFSAPATLSALQRAGSDTGYGSKQQITTLPSEDASGVMLIGISTWNNGDVWGFARVDNAGAVTLVDVFNWGGPATTTPLLAPTGDVAFDPVTGLIISTYTTSSDARVQLFSPITLAASGSSVQLFNFVFDIPGIVRARTSANRTLIIGRDAINSQVPPPPGGYKGYAATLDWL